MKARGEPSALFIADPLPLLIPDPELDHFAAPEPVTRQPVKNPTAPECPDCGCRDCGVLRTRAIGRSTQRLRRCRYCAREFWTIEGLKGGTG